MIQETISVEQTLEFLNEALKTDPDAVQRLFEKKAVCNDAMAGHPTIQVDCADKGFPKFGVLGLLNGLFGIDEKGWGAIAAVYSLTCPVGGESHKVSKDATIRDVCPKCGVRLTLGRLLKFERARPA